MKNFFLILIILMFLKIVSNDELGKTNGAYIKTPDQDLLEFRLGNSAQEYLDYKDYLNNSIPDLIKMAGYNGYRKNFSPNDIEDKKNATIQFCQKNIDLGLLDIIGYLNIVNSDFIFSNGNLYKPIWEDEENSIINKDNYWAKFVYNIINTYKKYVKIWEVWENIDLTLKNDPQNWMVFPPNSSDLEKWKWSIFEYIRLLRITYDIAKKLDPECWISVGGIKYYEFLDALLRYTDNPINGTITNDFPTFGGAYFDCISYNKEDWAKIRDLESNQIYNNNGSDSLAMKLLISKKNHHYIIKKYGFGDKYPDKIFIINKVDLSTSKKEFPDIELLRRNFIIKLSLLSLEYNIKQIHSYTLRSPDDNKGDYSIINIENITDNINHLKNSSKGRIILNKINIGKFKFDKKKTNQFRKKLPKNLSQNLSGIVLKRHFPRENNEKYYFKYIYSAWIYCDNNEISGSVSLTLNIPFNPLMIDWEGNENNITNETSITISSTPIFLLGNIDNESNEEEDDEDNSKRNKDNDLNDPDKNNNSMVIKYIIIFGILFLIIIVIFIVLIIYKKKKSKSKNNGVKFEINNELGGGLLIKADD